MHLHKGKNMNISQSVSSKLRATPAPVLMCQQNICEKEKLSEIDKIKLGKELQRKAGELLALGNKLVKTK